MGSPPPQAESIAFFSPVVQWLVTPFMLVRGVNFALSWHLLNRDIDLFLGSAPTLEIGETTAGVLENSLRQAAFQIASPLNSTGYATSDFAQWDTDAQVLLLFAMFIGGSAGSTGGGVKIIRWLVVMKVARRELFTAAHPCAVKPIRLGEHVIDEHAVRDVLGVTLLYLVLFVVGMVLLALDASRVGLAITPLEVASVSVATLGNIGPGFGFPGPFGSYVGFLSTSKLLMVFLMLVGRLEIIPVLALFTGGFWRQ